MKAQIVSFHCVLKNQVGQVISSTFNQDVLTYLEGHQIKPLPGLVEGLQNLHKGEKRKIHVSAEKAYGYYDPELVIEISRNDLMRTGELTPEDQLFIRSNQGDSRWFRVVGIQGDTVTLDGNHPLAGQDLVFEIEATEAREATAEEIEGSQVEKVGGQYLH